MNILPKNVASVALFAAITLVLTGAACTAAAENTATPLPTSTAIAAGPTPTATASPTPTPSPTPTQPPRIAYVSEDGDILSVHLDGTHETPLTDQAERGEDSRYTWPTWAPEGDRVAFSSVELQDNGVEMALHVVNEDGTDLREVYRSPISRTFSFVAPNAPHYAYWSPNGEQIAFLAAGDRSGRLTLMLADAQGDEDAQEVFKAVPLYFTWAESGTAILMHTDADIRAVDTDLPLRPALVGPPSIDYRTPAWSPDGRRSAYVGPTDNGAALFVAPIGQTPDQGLLPVSNVAAFTWAPSGDNIAVAMSEPGELAYSGIDIVDTVEGFSRNLVSEPVLAFYWSPNGRQLAYVTRGEQERTMNIYVVNVAGGLPFLLATFTPSADLVIHFSFFDQYGLSHSLWSPDSEHMVITGALADQPQDEPRVFVLDSQGREPPREIATGSLAFFAPR